MLGSYRLPCAFVGRKFPAKLVEGIASLFGLRKASSDRELWYFVSVC